MNEPGFLQVEQAVRELVSVTQIGVPLAVGAAVLAGLLIMVAASLVWRRH